MVIDRVVRRTDGAGKSDGWEPGYDWVLRLGYRRVRGGLMQRSGMRLNEDELCCKTLIT